MKRALFVLIASKSMPRLWKQKEYFLPKFADGYKWLSREWPLGKRSRQRRVTLLSTDKSVTGDNKRGGRLLDAIHGDAQSFLSGGTPVTI
jgi:hypothetical protein